jgi:hypothetical protein
MALSLVVTVAVREPNSGVADTAAKKLASRGTSSI